METSIRGIKGWQLSNSRHNDNEKTMGGVALLAKTEMSSISPRVATLTIHLDKVKICSNRNLREHRCQKLTLPTANKDLQTGERKKSILTNTRGLQSSNRQRCRKKLAENE